MDGGRQFSERLWSRTIMFALLAVLVGAGMIIAAASWSGLGETVLGGIGSVVVSLGLITIVQEVYLREALVRELLEFVGLQRRLFDAGIQEICSSPDLDWKKFLQDGETYRLLLIEPTVFVDRDWNHVLDSGRSRAISVEVYLPNPEGPSLDVVAAVEGLRNDEFKQSLERAGRSLQDSWTTAALSKPALVGGSAFALRFYDQVPALALLMCDEDIVFIANRVVDNRAGGAVMAFRFRATSNILTRAWADEQIARLRELAPSYAAEVPKK
jgi:hypothetical protein